MKPDTKLAFTAGPWTQGDTIAWGHSVKAGKHYIAFKIKNKADQKLIAAAPDLLEACKDLFAMMDEGLLVRDTANDADSGWAIKQLKFVARLKQAHDAVTKATQ